MQNGQGDARWTVGSVTDIARPSRSDRTACDYVPTSSFPVSAYISLSDRVQCAYAVAVPPHRATRVASPPTIRKSASGWAGRTWALVGISDAYSDAAAVSSRGTSFIRRDSLLYGPRGLHRQDVPVLASVMKRTRRRDATQAQSEKA